MKIILRFIAVPILATLALAGCASTGDNEPPAAGGEVGNETLVLSTFPFGIEEFQEAIIDPFTAETGIRVEVETGFNADRLAQLQLAAGDNPGVDVMLISDYYAALGQEDQLFQQVDASQVPHLGEISEFATDAAYFGPAYSYQLNGILYRSDELSPAEAADWDVFADANYAGKLALPDMAVTAGQLTVSGVAETYGSGPYDVDAAFSTMANWAPGILQFYSSSTEVSNLITQGEIVAAAVLNGFATNLIASGEPIGWTQPAQGAYMATNRVMIPAGAKNVSAAHQFINYLLSVEAQSASAEKVGDLPVNPGAKIPERITAVVGEIGADPIKAGYSTLDPSELVPTRNEWMDRFAREVSSR